MDSVDREILGILQEDGRITATELSKKVRLGLSATSERLRQLQTSGVVTGFRAVVEPTALGRPIEALVDVRLSAGAPQGLPEDLLLSLDMVIDAVHLTGRFDTQLRVAAADVTELDHLLIKLKEMGAEETNTRLVLRTIDGFPRAALPKL